MPTHQFPQPPQTRYSNKPFPSYRFILGENPHPTVDKEGHSFGKPEEDPGSLTPDNWRSNELYLYGIDLYNYAFWWEAHEALEGLWGLFGRGTAESDFLQGLIKISAALLKWHLKDWRGVKIHYEGGTKLLAKVASQHPVYMGVDLKEHLEKLEAHFRNVLVTQAPRDPGTQGNAGSPDPRVPGSRENWPDPLADYPFIALKK